MKELKAKLVGVAPLIMHNARLANPTDPLVRELKKLTSLRKKTDDVALQIKEIEWNGGLYLDESGVPALPSDLILASLLGGAKKSRLGKESQAAVYSEHAFFRLDYEGPKDVKKLYADPRFCDYRSVVVSRQRVMRARPIFRSWGCDVSLQIDEEILNLDQAREALVAAGARVGLGDFRPRYGRFLVE